MTAAELATVAAGKAMAKASRYKRPARREDLEELAVDVRSQALELEQQLHGLGREPLESTENQRAAIRLQLLDAMTRLAVIGIRAGVLA